MTGRAGATPLPPIWLGLLLPLSLSAQHPEPISDNSFLIEEAYNQEAGVVQHISTFARPGAGDTWAYTLTQEWPLNGLKRQLSYTIPLLREDGGGAGLGDIALSFRYQLAGDGGDGLHVAPRATLLLPTGDERRGRGAGGVGFQANLPVSARPVPQLAFHANAGLTYTPSTTNPAGLTSRTLNANLGGSTVWLLRPAFNVMLELLWLSTERVVGPGERIRESQWLLNPGLRGAFDFASGLQIVPGIAYTVDLGDGAGDDGLFLYLSLEHPFRR